MTIGKSSKKTKVPCSPPFLDRASGFYGRLDETETELKKEVGSRGREPAEKTTPGETSCGERVTDEQEHGFFDFNQGMMEDDEATLLQRKPSRLSRRWSRKSSRRTKADQNCPETDGQSKGTVSETNFVAPSVDQQLNVKCQGKADPESVSTAPEPILVHFSIREDSDDQVLISESRERQKQMEEKCRGREMEGKTDGENMMVVKKSTLKNYRKAFDRVLRRGWENFVANLYSVTLTPVSSSSSTTTSTTNRNAYLAEYK
ncbi:uncharacterized protein sb:cb1058 [Hoplias malabaricus]|uniref:uncharacterized protein sb:cb1058 n=1 Tax=Hoplias malabaricus TaxID=27720 RepID=UPI00346214C4